MCMREKFNWYCKVIVFFLVVKILDGIFIYLGVLFYFEGVFFYINVSYLIYIGLEMGMI